jgi:hypothetical protein
MDHCDPAPSISIRRSRAIAGAVTAALALAGAIYCGAPAQAAEELIEVDFSTSTGAFKGGAAGMLYGLGDAEVPTSALVSGAAVKHLTQKPVNGQQHPNGDPFDTDELFFENGGEYILINIQDWYPG